MNRLTCAQKEYAYKLIIGYFGSNAIVANVCQVTRQAVAIWRRFGIPYQHVDLLVKSSKGKLKKQKLRPDLFEEFI